jgi:protein SCO1
VKRRVFVSAGLLAALPFLASATGCKSRRELPANAPSRPAITPGAPVSASAKRYPFKGVITAVDFSKPAITVSHEAIPGFMDAMTMSFPVRDDPKVVALLRPGDRIEARLVVDGNAFFLENVLTKGFVPTPTASSSSSSVRPEPNRGVGVGELAPDFTLTDQNGKSVRLSQFRGEPVAVTFVYTRCPVATACPVTVGKFSKIAAALVKEKFGTLLAVTVDPAGDTPAVLKDYATRVGADPTRWKFLTGDPAAVARVAERFGVLYYPDHGQIVHSQAVAVVDPDGRIANVYYGEEWEAESVLQDLEKARKG